MKGYVWYSFGSDTTGLKLAEALEFNSGKKTPPFSDYDVVVGWGCKPGEKYNPAVLKDLVERREIRVLNHPDNVSDSRHKLSTLKKMADAGVRVPGFTCSSEENPNLLTATLEGLEQGALDFPILGLNAYHKGYPAFCYTVDDVTRAVGSKRKDELHYFRSFCPGKEYRIFVFRDTALCAEVKVLAEDPLASCSEHLLKKLKRRADIQKVKLRATQQELGWIAEELAQDLLTGPNHLQRSVTHGWSLSPAPLEKVGDEMIMHAIWAVDAVGLDLGAVSLVWDDDVPRVTGVISAPGLSEEQTVLYASSIQEFAEAEEPRAKKAAAKAGAEEKAPKELVARLRRKLSGVSRERAKEILKTLEE